MASRKHPFLARQGDVLIIGIAALPPNLETVKRDAGRVVLAYGEVTGHAHAIAERGATLFRDPKLNALFLNVAEDGVALRHDEHGAIDLPRGDYQVIRQREYSPEEIRNVAD